MRLLQIDMMREVLGGILTKFGDAIPGLLTGLFIFLIGWIAASVISKIIRKTLSKIGVDSFGERLTNIDIIQKSNIKLRISVLVSKLIYFTLMLFTALAATSVLGMPEVSELMSNIIEFIPHLVVGFLVLIIGTLFADALRSLLHTTLSSLGVGAANLIASGVFYFLFINVVISAMSQAKLNTDFLSQNLSILIGGIVFAFAIGYGLASKDTMANFISSFYSKDIFKVGDLVTIEGCTGTISDISKTTLTISTENSKVIMPLSKALGSKIEFHN